MSATRNAADETAAQAATPSPPTADSAERVPASRARSPRCRRAARPRRTARVRRPGSASTPTIRAAAARPSTRRSRQAPRRAAPCAGRSSDEQYNHVLPERSDVVVIGGGVMGAAALHYLVELGCERPVLVERETLASGLDGPLRGRRPHALLRRAQPARSATSRSAASSGSRRGRRRARPAALGLPLPARRRRPTRRASPPTARSMLAPDEARELVPQLDVDGLVAAAFDERAGYVTPDLVVQGYARRAAARGAHIEQSCAATRIVATDGRVTASRRRAARSRRSASMLTAGVWSRELYDLPVERERRHMFFTEDAPAFPRELPLTIDFASGFYFHREGDGARVRRSRADARGARAHRGAPAAGARGARHPLELVGLVRDEPGPQRARRCRAGAVGARTTRRASPGHGFQQGPGGRRASRAARARARADVRPLAVRGRALRDRRAQASSRT